jgi:galactosamine-6-phosphate isomerase
MGIPAKISKHGCRGKKSEGEFIIMELKIFDTYEALSVAAADLVIDTVKKKPGAVLCFASGDTPKRAYDLVAERAKKENVDFTQCVFIGLDEWLGVPPGDPGSCHFFLQQYLIIPLGLHSQQVHLFDGLTTSDERECEKMNKLIAQKGIDCMIVGVGMNGHIGFNEPGTDINSLAHVSELDIITITVGQKYFTDAITASKGITIGLKQVIESGTLVMVANGSKKAPVIKRAVEGEITNAFPASLIRQHPHSILMIDTEAASDLKKT